MDELLILQKWEDMVDYGYTALRQYPQSEKFALAAESRSAMWEIGSYIMQANGLRSKEARRRRIQDADLALSRLKVMVRAAHRMRFLPGKKYELWSARLVELGKMLGGWLSATAKG